jgi:predicted permease
MMRAASRAVRSLARTPGFTVATVLSVALGIGATTTVFTFTNSLLFKPVAVREPDRLAYIATADPQGHDAGAPPALVDLLRSEARLDGLCGFLTPLSTVEINETVSPRPAHAFSGDCFRTLGVLSAAGRVLGPADDQPGAPSVAMLTYETWLREYGGRREAIGQQIAIEGRLTTIVGVTEQGFRGLLLGFPAQVVYPLSLLRDHVRARASVAADELPVYVFGRLPPGESLAETGTRLQAMGPRLLHASIPPSADGPKRKAYLERRLSVRSAATGVDYSLRARFSVPALALLGLSAVLLLISCVNVANLLLARGLSRRPETALRAALGAGQWTLVREALLENALLLIAGIAVGVSIGYGADHMFLAVMGAMMPGLDLDLTPDRRTLVFTSAAIAVVIVTIVVIPVLWDSRADPRTLLGGAVTRVVRGSTTTRGVLVSTQVALALALVTLASLFATSLVRLHTRSVGFEPGRILGAQLMLLPDSRANSAPDETYYRELLARISRIPGAEAVALARSVPFLGRPMSATLSDIRLPDSPVRAELAIITEGFFATMHIPMVAGRDFQPADTSRSPLVAIVSESLARKLSPGRDSVGIPVRVAVGNTTYDKATVVGVASDAVIGSPKVRNVLVAYLSIWQTPDMLRQPALLVRAADDPSQVIGPMRRELQALGREYPSRVRSLRDERDAALAQEQLLAFTAAAFAVLGLLLAAVGLYGVLNFMVASRREELGLRLALGADPTHVMGLVLRRALRLMGTGVAIGMPLAWAGVRTSRAVLTDSASFDLVSVAVVVACLGFVAVVASALPARRAASMTPLDALRGH